MKLDIVTFRDLKDRGDLYHLWAQSFGWLAAPRWLNQWIDYEEWLQGIPVGFCGLINGELAGFVGVMEIPTRDRTGQVELVGGIWAVATRPSCQRQGVGRKLLDAAEDYFRKRQFRLSFLTTSRAIVAHSWYESVGYRDIQLLDGYSHIYKILKAKPVASGKPRKSKSQPLDHSQVVANFTRHMRNNCGFVFRSARRLEFLERMGAYDPTNSESNSCGHLLASRQFGSSRVIELVAESKKACAELVKSLEKRTPEAVYLSFVSDPLVIDVLTRARYRRDCGSYDVLMAKSLGAVDFNQVYDSTFRISRCEFF